MSHPRYPALYQVNTRVWLNSLSEHLGHPATLDDVPNAELDQWARQGFDWIWLISVWQTGQTGQHVSRTNLEWRKEFVETLPDLTDADIPGSGFAIFGYTVHENLGGDAALARLRQRMQQRGLKLMLDFVPNHTALDHPWVQARPEYYIAGTEEDLAKSPQNFTRIQQAGGEQIFAYGRDPYFAGWPDTLQLNYANPATQVAMQGELLRIAGQCDGVRCDMAMLVLPEIFQRTWGLTSPPFWAQAIDKVRTSYPDFCFLAEVYWDLEWNLQQLGFNYAYDKRLYDRLHAGIPRPVREHFLAGLDYQDKLARFLENHDEPRAAATFIPGKHQAAAAITFLSPGLRFFHQGEFEGCVKRISPHLGRAPQETVNQELKAFYNQLLEVLRQPLVREGDWQMLESTAGWEGNWTWDSFLAFWWSRGGGQQHLLVVVNYAPYQGQCLVHLPLEELSGGKWQLQDQFSPARSEHDAQDLQHGLFVDAAPWQAAAYLLSRRPGGVIS